MGFLKLLRKGVINMADFSQGGKVLTTKEVAELLKVSVQTIKNYIYQGKLKTFKTPGGHHRILESELLRQLEDLMKGLEEEEIREERKELEEELVSEKKEVHSIAVDALLQVLDKKQNFPWGHSKRVAGYVNSMAEKIGLSSEEARKIELAALLHDIGKIEIDTNILSKPEELTEEEFDVIKKHPQIGENIVKEISSLNETGPLILSHHERFDGAGYPYGLKGEEIPLGARMIAIAETFDGLVSQFPFCVPFSRKEAIDVLRKNAGGQLDPKLVEKFIEIVE